MALNLTEAAAVNDVLRHLIGARRPGDSEPPSRSDAIKALSLLTGRAFAKLGAGYSADSARDNLTALWPGALLDVWMAELHGAEPEPFATEQLARHHVLTEGGWDAGSDLSWRTGHTDDAGRSAKILYCDGTHTLCCIWPTHVRFSPLDGAPTIDVREENPRACKTCGCTEDEPCEGGCAWVVDGTLEIDLCTACAWAIARDAIASGLYQLQPTDGDTLFEARGGLIPQPMLTEAEIDALQPLIEEVEAARGDVGKLEEIMRREQAKLADAVNPAKGDRLRLAVAERAFFPLRMVPPLGASATDLVAAIEAAPTYFVSPPPATAYELEYAVYDGGARGPVMSKQKAESYIDDLYKLHPDEPANCALQSREVGPWENVIDRRRHDTATTVQDESAAAATRPQVDLDEAAATRATAFLAAWDERHTARDQVLVQVKPGSPDMLASDDLRTLLTARARLAGEVEQLQVELGYAIAADDADDELTLRDVDPDAVYATEDDDFHEERAEAYGPATWYDGEAPF